ncbi:prepilin peptidase [Solimicrobium silvestre]|uniref:Prepilin leader peptidase/N-methyltransferase n=1 Tax=Solimicrobium silvestre TaxID=2099400 RepID=A0A2S9GUI8_9BURK|nr:A24 family peptidase [Solimicrobium silvestre]PRC91397.1 Type II secretory pathway prepilin signal peptidase PulO and related peptidase [Solimicrobium silvestre]
MIFDLYIVAARNLPASLIAGLFGLLIGSFLNVVIYRVPKMMQRDFDNYVAEQSGHELPHQDMFNLMLPRSACPQCGHKISAIENIPVLSFIALRGRCAGCKTPISMRYPLVEMLTALVSFGLVWHFGTGLAGISSLVFGYLLIALALIDFDTQLLPDDLTLPLLWCGLLINTQGVFCSLNSAVLGAAIGYISLWSIYWIFKLVTGKEGMGYGDFKLLAALGAWCGWTVLPVIILCSSLAGAIIGLSLIWFAKRGRDIPMPFGPYLAIAGLVMLPFGQLITQKYLGIVL